MATSKRGFAGMSNSKQRKIASEGGQAQGAHNNPENFANDPQKASDAVKKSGGGNRSGS